MMKMLLLATAVLLVLGACASLPPPESESSALVVGYLVEDYPDGFFNKPPRTLQYGITIGIRNLTQGSTFSVKTNDGYFYFLSNGTDAYVLDTYELTLVESGEGNYQLGGRLGRTFTAEPGKIVYLGHLTITRSQPKKSQETGHQSYWDFDTSADYRWENGQVLEYLREIDSQSVWLGREIVQMR